MSQVSLPDRTPGLQQNNKQAKCYLKKKKKRQCKETKEVLVTILELSNRDCKITMIMLFKYVKVSNGKSRQHARMNGQYKERKEKLRKKIKIKC